MQNNQESRHATAGLDVQKRSDKKNNLPTNQNGYDNSETIVGKLSARKTQIFRIPFSVIIFDLLFSSEVSDPSEVPRINRKFIFELANRITATSRYIGQHLQLTDRPSGIASDR